MCGNASFATDSDKEIGRRDMSDPDDADLSSGRVCMCGVWLAKSMAPSYLLLSRLCPVGVSGRLTIPLSIGCLQCARDDGR